MIRIFDILLYISHFSHDFLKNQYFYHKFLSNLICMLKFSYISLFYSQSPSSRTSKDLPYFSEMSGPGNLGTPYQMMVNPGMGPNPSNPQPPINYHSSAYKRPNIYINKRIGEAGVELEPHKRLPQQVVNPQFRPMTNQMSQHQQPGFLQQLFGLGGSESGITRPTPNIPTSPGGSPLPQQHIRPVPLQQQQLPLQQQHVIHNGPQTFRAVSENDLYLLGAIEKLVYRVDYLESRVRRTEQLIYYLMAGNKQQTDGKLDNLLENLLNL